MALQHVAVGFLYHAASRKVLLHLRDADKPPSAGLWAFFGGRSEPEDGGDLLATFVREMREEIGVTLDPERVRSLRHGVYEDGRLWAEYFSAWPALDEDFTLTEGQRYGWFTIDEAYAQPNLADYARDALTHFRSMRIETACEEAQT